MRGSASPLCFRSKLSLGLVEGVSPALQERIAKQMAEAGATQDRVLQWIRSEHGVSMASRLRDLVASVSQEMSEFQLEVSVGSTNGRIENCNESKGNRKPVLSVGRDGITLCELP